MKTRETVKNNDRHHPQPVWQRIALLIILGYEAAGALSGGFLLSLAPDGRLMDMPVEIMHGFFKDFFLPGVILIGLGILNSLAFISVLKRNPYNWFMSSVGLGGLAIWFFVEILVLQEVHWLHALWGLPVILGCLLIIPALPFSRETWRKVCLYSGIGSSLLYVAMNIFVPMGWEDYHSASRVVSELSAVNAPTRFTWTLFCIPYTLLMVAFGWGVLESAGQNRHLRTTGWLLLIFSSLGIAWPFAPMHLRETLAAGGGTWSDTMHIALGGITQVFFLLSMGFAAAALGRSFRIYSVLSFLILIVFGVLTFLDSPGLAKNQPTPLIGVWERINIGVFLLWVVVLAVILIPLKRVRE